ncbi:MAG: hypothetical protein ACI8VE_000084 [Natrialbaceae archaeon]|jgi:hypothetical protein
MAEHRERLLATLDALAAELGRAPTPAEIDANDDHSMAAYREAFGSWGEALAVAGLEPAAGRRIPDEALLAELRRLARELEKTPSEEDMRHHGNHSINTYKHRFGSWNEAIAAADLAPNPDRTERSREALLGDIKRAADDLGRPPTRREMSAYTEFDPITYRNRFGSWNQALEAAGLDSRPAQERVSDDELLTELQRLADELEKPPTTTDMEQKGEFSPGTYYKRFDSWNDALEAAGCERS